MEPLDSGMLVAQLMPLEGFKSDYLRRAHMYAKAHTDARPWLMIGPDLLGKIIQAASDSAQPKAGANSGRVLRPADSRTIYCLPTC